MSSLAALLRDHKAEIEDVLAADKQLAKELLFDMKRAEQVRAQQNMCLGKQIFGAPGLGDGSGGQAGQGKPSDIERTKQVGT